MTDLITPVNLIILVTYVALLLYILLGGADYGAGILEVFRGSKSEQGGIVDRAIGPVWEANHMWLVLMIVILFNGFPRLFVTLTTFLHIPLVAILVGIVVRGVTFTFRHYDVRKGNGLYTWAFSLSSLWTSLWFGVILAAMVLGRIDPAGSDVFSLYVAPWWNLFCLATAWFVAALFTYLAACYLVGEAESEEMKSFFRRRALAANLALVFLGGLVFAAAEHDGAAFTRTFLREPACLACVGLATLFWAFQWFYPKLRASRVLAGGQVTFILLGFAIAQHPTVIQTKPGPLTFAGTAAPAATMFQLLLALLVGLCIILPSLVLLFWIFKKKTLTK